MNAAFLDAQNLAWKIHHVEAGFADRATLLKSYESERKHFAEDLLDFDARFAKLFSTRIPAADEVAGANAGHDAPENEFIKTFKESCEFTSGYGVAYPPNALNWSSEHAAQSSLFLSAERKQTPLRTGRIMANADVTRVVDANSVHLEQEIPLNGSFKIYVFGGRGATASSPTLASFAAAAMRKGSFLASFLRQDLGKVSYHERHNPHSRFFTFCTVLAMPHADIAITALPDLLARYADHVYADDVGEGGTAHKKMGLSEHGGIVVVRPDGYVGCVVRLEDGTGTVDALDAFFGCFTSKKLGRQRNAQL